MNSSSKDLSYTLFPAALGWGSVHVTNIFMQSGPKSPDPSPPHVAYGKWKRCALRYYFRPRVDCPEGHPALGQNV